MAPRNVSLPWYPFETRETDMSMISTSGLNELPVVPKSCSSKPGTVHAKGVAVNILVSDLPDERPTTMTGKKDLRVSGRPPTL